VNEIIRRRIETTRDIQSFVPDAERRDIEVQTIMSQLKIVDFT